MKTVRLNSFETNSSSTHSLCVVPVAEYEAWENGQRVYDSYAEKIVPWEEKTADRYKWKSYDEFFEEDDAGTYISYVEEYVSPSGDKLVIFGKYGYNG